MILEVFVELEGFQEFGAFRPHYYRSLVVKVVLEPREAAFHCIPRKKGHFVPCHMGMFVRIRWEFVYD